MFSKAFFLFASAASALDLLLPLYQYPDNGAATWQYIADAMTNNTNLPFRIVINPQNGPGDATHGLNDTKYRDAIGLLSPLPNAHIYGYIHTSTDLGAHRCNRDWNELRDDILTWTKYIDAGYNIAGIFVDEAALNSDNDCVNYMQNLTTFIRTDPRAKFSERGVIFNPGGPGLQFGDLEPYYQMKPDLILALETCFVEPSKGRGFGVDDCPTSGGYEIYDSEGVGGSVHKYLDSNVHPSNYGRTAILVHGFHDDNTQFTATADSLKTELQALEDLCFGAAFFTTNAYFNFTQGPADIMTSATVQSSLTPNATCPAS